MIGWPAFTKATAGRPAYAKVSAFATTGQAGGSKNRRQECPRHQKEASFRLRCARNGKSWNSFACSITASISMWSRRRTTRRGLTPPKTSNAPKRFCNRLRKIRLVEEQLLREVHVEEATDSAWRIRLWLRAGEGCPGRRLSKVRGSVGIPSLLRWYRRFGRAGGPAPARSGVPAPPSTCR